MGEPYIGMDEYRDLSLPLRREFDAWLRAEGLHTEHMTWFRLLEGAIEAECYATDADGHVMVVNGDELVPEMRVYPISTAPPKAALVR